MDALDAGREVEAVEHAPGPGGGLVSGRPEPVGQCRRIALLPEPGLGRLYRRLKRFTTGIGQLPGVVVEGSPQFAGQVGFVRLPGGQRQEAVGRPPVALFHLAIKEFIRLVDPVQFVEQFDDVGGRPDRPSCLGRLDGLGDPLAADVQYAAVLAQVRLPFQRLFQPVVDQARPVGLVRRQFVLDGEQVAGEFVERALVDEGQQLGVCRLG